MYCHGQPQSLHNQNICSKNEIMNFNKKLYLRIEVDVDFKK